MLRYLTEVLPVMVTPKWVSTNRQSNTVLAENGYRNPRVTTSCPRILLLVG
jgi:hypothetical protein